MTLLFWLGLWVLASVVFGIFTAVNIGEMGR